jgi:adenine-specific DNA-methyltransferase
MANDIVKNKIQQAIKYFAENDLTKGAVNLFQTLGYNTDRQAPLAQKNFTEFKEDYIDQDKNFNEEKALVSEWKYVDLLFQLSKEEILKQSSLFDTKQVDNTVIETYLFFSIELSQKSYTRTALSNITREVNKLFPMPVMILFRHGNTLTLSVINRRLHKRDVTKDVLEKVTQIKDINTKKPHRAHVEILFDLSFDELQRKYNFSNFVELHNAWQKTLDIQELNKRFFNELASWYFWATTQVVFPDDEIKDKDTRNATGVIRLITRLMFVWFLKEKNLVPDELFDERKLKSILKFSDKKKSTFYKAVLQNLFFATLNTEMGKRKFRGKNEQNRDGHYFIHNVFRYEDEFTEPNKTLESYFDPIPFLNGGLFECLDKQIEEKNKLKSIRIDGFSDREDNTLKVSDELFFGAEKTVDLTAFYDPKSKRKQHYKVRGLIHILDSYKFTITENTPIDEEIALDPELLGKVFENLLANYNPETKTTARKQTGSFYTPREIVNYMVDESLIAYLKQQLDEKDETEVKIRMLLSYSEKETEFNEGQKDKLIRAIDVIKIIDPACGSGAFPMGVLHKLVHILHKIDPKNQKWEQRQLNKVDKLIAKAEEIPDTKTRNNVIADLQKNREGIIEAFENNELDYGRKLFLIENCIYGVDIQAIAAQISKLRFFISLIVDQKTDNKKENLGIRPLPNLETKFVAANTLIELEKENANLFTNPEIETKKAELKKVRHKYFEARTPKTKEKCRQDDKRLRNELADILTKDHYLQPEAAKKLAAWDPYDQNASASFFDSEWMFGLNQGFDAVIGNPPWGAKLSIEDKQLFKRVYPEIDSSTPNSFAYFVGWAFNNYSGIISYVLPDSILIKDYSKTRKLIKDYIKEIQWYENTGMPEEHRPFVYVDHDVCVINIFKEKIADLSYSLFRFDKSSKSIGEIKLKQKKSKIILEEFDFAFNLIAREKDFMILEKIQQFDKLADFMQCHEGIHTGNSRDLLFIQNQKNKFCHPLFYGGGAGDIIDNYVSQTSGWFVDYRKSIIDKSKGYYASLRDERIFKNPKIYITRTGNPFKAFYDFDTYASNNFFSLQHLDYTKNGVQILKYILPFINSKISQYFIRTFAAPRLGSTFIETKIFHLLKFRVPILIKKDQKSIITLVNYVIHYKIFGKDTTYFERLLDAILYELYFPEEIKSAGAEVLKHLKDLPELTKDDEKNLKLIEQVQKELSDSKHPVSLAMFKMDTIEEIRIIEGKA